MTGVQTCALPIYDGTSNYNLVLGADILRKRVRVPSSEDVRAMAEIGMPLD